MIDFAKLRIGDKVHYEPEHYEDEWENGIIKEIRESNTKAVFVVYNCAGNWDEYQNYTGALTSLCDLKLGWKF